MERTEGGKFSQWKKDPALRIAGVYLFLCALWILFSDRLLLWVARDADTLTRLQTAKGWAFILASSLLLFYFIRRFTAAEGAQREILQQLFDNLPVMVVFLDPERRVLFANRAWERTLGWRLDEARNRDLFDEFYPDPGYRGEVLASIASTDGQWRDFRVRVRDGRMIDNAWANVRLSNGCIIGIGQDVTARKRAEAALRESEERLQLALKAAGLGTWHWDVESDVVVWDDHLPPLFGLPPERKPRTRAEFFELLLPEDRERVSAEVARCLEEDAPFDLRFGVVRPDGIPRRLAARGKLYRDPQGRAQRLTGVCWDITEREQAELQLREKEERLHFLAHHDVLTRLPNRLLLHDRMQHALAKARRSGGRVAIVFLDLDRFKMINDSLGHAVGDRVLKEVAGRLSRHVREADTVARLGGDEFVIVLEEVQEVEKIASVAQKLLLDLAREIPVDGHRLYVTASAGIGLFPDDGVDAEGLMKCAETAMYRAKERGKNMCQYFTPDMNARAREILLMESGLRQALDRSEFVLHYQPQIDLATGALIGVEALVRWKHPDRGIVAPMDFIPLAEETGLIVPIGEWVLRTACAQSRAWREAGHPPLRMAVNISPRQFRQLDLAARVAAILADTGMEPERLELEVTEGMIMNDLEEAVATMEQLGRMGVHLAIDDFGTGYSSLAYLKRFPIAGLKIDRSFVRDVTTDSSDAQIAASVIALAHSMNLRVVAEGIETEGQLSFLKAHGCDEGQGFLFSRPCPASEFVSRFFPTR